MRLLLSTACLPNASPEELRRARQRHGFSGYEVDVTSSIISDVVRCPLHQSESDSLTEIAWYRVPAGIPEHLLMLWAGQAHEVNAGVIVRDVLAHPLGVPTAIECSASGTSCECAPAGEHAVRPCWSLDSRNLPERKQLEVLLAHDATRPVHIRLAGAGPEASSIQDEQSALEIGAFFGDLAVLGYDGTLALVPSAPAELGAWRKWLIEDRGWGCGTAAEKRRRRMQTQPIES